MSDSIATTTPQIHEIRTPDQFPSWLTRDKLALFLHESLKPYEDSVADIDSALGYVFGEDGGRGGFILLGEMAEKPVGALVMLHTGMKGYIPEDILLFIAVDPSVRGKGVGRKIIEKALDLCPGDVKLHVEYQNPAKRLYERIGFTTKYAEMRYHR
jgi:GNAT superfamily N-acetyltransferase